MAAFSEEIVEIKCDPHKILNNTYLYRFFCSKFKSYHSVHTVYSCHISKMLPCILLTPYVAIYHHNI